MTTVISIFLSNTQVHKFRILLLKDTFFHRLTLFEDFLPNQTHIAKISFRFLETQGSTIESINGLLLLSRAPPDSIDTTVLIRLFLLL